jgi:hypothetical protein
VNSEHLDTCHTWITRIDHIRVMNMSRINLEGASCDAEVVGICEKRAYMSGAWAPKLWFLRTERENE